MPHEEGHRVAVRPGGPRPIEEEVVRPQRAVRPARQAAVRPTDIPNNIPRDSTGRPLTTGEIREQIRRRQEKPELAAEQETVISKIADTVIGAGPALPLIAPGLIAEAISPGNPFSGAIQGISQGIRGSIGDLVRPMLAETGRVPFSFLERPTPTSTAQAIGQGIGSIIPNIPTAGSAVPESERLVNRARRPGPSSPLETALINLEIVTLPVAGGVSTQHIGTGIRGARAILGVRGPAVRPISAPAQAVTRPSIRPTTPFQGIAARPGVSTEAAEVSQIPTQALTRGNVDPTDFLAPQRVQTPNVPRPPQPDLSPTGIRTSTRGAVRPTRQPTSSSSPPPPRGGRNAPTTPDEFPSHQPNAVLRDKYGARGVESGLTKVETFINLVKTRIATLPIIRGTQNRALRSALVLKDPSAQRILGERRRVQRSIDSVSARSTGVVVEKAKQIFPTMKENLQIPFLEGVDSSVTGAPTLSDVAARLPRYRDRLSDEQIEGMALIRRELDPRIREMLVDIGDDVGIREDIIDGGFYIPRGGASQEGAEQPFIVAGERFGRPGFEMPAQIASQAEGISKGFEFRSLNESVGQFLRRSGNRGADNATEQAFRTAVDETGRPLAQSKVGDLPRTEDVHNLFTRYEGFGEKFGRGLGLEGPTEVVNAANIIIRSRAFRRELGLDSANVIETFNRVYLSFNATLDNSAPLIQGMLFLAVNPRLWGKAVKLNFLSWADSRVLDAAILDFDEAAKVTDMLGSDIWAREGLVFSGGQTEFTITGGETLAGSIGRLPGIRQANRAFSNFGDYARILWSHHELELEMRRAGRTAQQLLESGDVSRIANTINDATGISRGGVFSFADWLILAPRFLQARITTTARAVASLRPGATLEQRIARRSMIKFLAFSAAATEATNFLLGQETDRRPIVNGRRNSNFYRVRAFEGTSFQRDVSFMGTWGGLFGAATSIATGRPFDVLRSLGSGTVQNAWNTIMISIGHEDPFARNLTVERLLSRDNDIDNNNIAIQLAAAWIENLVPFAMDELPDLISGAITTAKESEPAKQAIGAVGLAATAGLEVLGVTSSKLGFRDIADSISREKDFGIFYADIEPHEQSIVREDDRVKATEGRFPTPKVVQSIKEAEDEFQVEMDLIVDSGKQVINGVDFGDARTVRNRYHNAESAMFNKKLGARRVNNDFGKDEQGNVSLKTLVENIETVDDALDGWYALGEAAERGTGVFSSPVLALFRMRYMNALEEQDPEFHQYTLRNIYIRDIPKKVKAALERGRPKTRRRDPQSGEILLDSLEWRELADEARDRKRKASSQPESTTIRPEGRQQVAVRPGGSR